ncbi:glycosyltransferase family 2 protein [Paenibacillus thiaminolyticus]|uniref:Glycosyltransferase family 2 protein n=1 Tax=Paenibacillus thiaminolyticus TaxID=49283 RepID=A0AAP9J294_PANTH|nr:glycosyltransferase family 2 protein [Paenibacillus thiaminolyticus]MCY9535738.1 glycosyltransferase family 2 protein [Paenibacillus thiaminolyticus]MCY9601070.1 glycosyltransferase family 2 protein [Paenibacillus thiaminolyticus]MCY9609515.1 glycosyltransferase family 2 protein [Paenibacillus thiaminolyticus]MCY9613211.1 glycosyltransferase family 2 protein [Paenibacillus thiaminolyticus]MCY9617626.1 glycosyltransferase family 2 protein [Paenibacillus thiaminolyticus]
MISLIIPTIHHTDLVKHCVNSFINTAHEAYEIIVVDDGSPPPIQQDLAAWAASMNVRFIPKQTNEGFSRTVNLGLQHAGGTYALVANNDIIFHEPGWLQHMMAAMQLSPDVGIVGARLLYPNMTIQHGGVIQGPKGNFDHRYRFQPADHPPAQAVEDAASVTGALMLIRRDVFDRIGLFSEEFFIAYEDVDFCYRARQHGFRVVYCGAACALHYEGFTRGTTRANKNWYWRVKELEARKKFWVKWGGYHIQ